MKRLRYIINRSTLTIIFGGNILSSKTEVIVSSDDIGISMEEGVAEAILWAGGEIVRKDAQKKLPAKLGDVVVSSAGAMKQKFIFHCLTHNCGRLPVFFNEEQLTNTQETDEYILRHLVDKCFDLLRALNLSSIAFPCIGAELANLPLKKVAEVMTREIARFLVNSPEHYEIELYFHIREKLQCLDLIKFIDYLALSSGLYPNNESFFIDLTIEGPSYKKVGLLIRNPNETIRDFINRIVCHYELPEKDRSGTLLRYVLGQLRGSDEPDLLDFEDEDGLEQSLLDYDVRHGDHLLLMPVPIAGGYNPMRITYMPRKGSFIRRLLGVKSDDVFSSVFAPRQIRKGTGMMVQVYLYKENDRDSVCYDAEKFDKRTEERAYSPLNFKLKLESVVDVRIRMQGVEVITPHKAIIWQGFYTKADFYIEIPEDYNKDQIWGEVFLSVDGALLGELDFLTELTTDEPDEYNTAPVITRQYKKIFISYAHQDESKVQYIARAYDAQGVDYFFDRHYLKPGDIFPLKIKEFIDTADLFILCWSANAAQSEYVELERKRALKRAYPNILHFEETPLSIYPMSIEPRAELPDDMRDTFSFIEITD